MKTIQFIQRRLFEKSKGVGLSIVYPRLRCTGCDKEMKEMAKNKVNQTAEYPVSGIGGPLPVLSNSKKAIKTKKGQPARQQGMVLPEKSHYHLKFGEALITFGTYGKFHMLHLIRFQKSKKEKNNLKLCVA